MESNEAPFTCLAAGQEADLVAAVQMGDRAAFLELVRHYQRPLYRLAYAMNRNGAEAEALAQSAFAHAWKSISDYPSGRRFYPWLLRILQSLLTKDPPARANQEQAGALEMALDSLRPEDRMPLALRIVERVRYAEIAALLDVPTGLVTLRIAQARGAILARAGGPEGRSQ